MTDNETMPALRRRLLAAARHAGVDTITASYEGGSDSGAIDFIAITPEDAKTRLADCHVEAIARVYDVDVQNFVSRPQATPFITALTDFLGWMLERQHGNWWDGAIETYGEITWHVSDDPDRITGEHNHIVREAQYDAWEEDREAGTTAVPATAVEA
jgi:hypothetical protein